MSRKPAKKEFWLSLKITFLGTILIGGIGFVIKFISSSMIQGISV
ncbi:protein translocase SEC61 complex subunit gamma [Candidatus Bathyarchaeota archaeon]|nr:MAG: protein translocase SEC61 complex subunit gamma [Candidatus Bathyarchaeota archaeon]